MATSGLLDTNVFLRHILQDQAEHSRLATELFARIELGEITVRTLDTVVFEAVYVMEQKFSMPRNVIAGSLAPLLGFPGIELSNKEIYPAVFELWVTTRRLSFADAFHLVSAKHLGLDTIISFDRGLRGVEGVTRVEPPLG